ncbi:hypothetical protein AB6805_22570 [Chitinophaga sp. RCC_12]|uniref:hypothetical protein n=1 Tax=Chitinophaga sp. RCC_12 TaxID=3239226 RepID=UPI003525CF06
MKAIAAGLFGTLLMTGALYLLTAITGKNYKVVGVLATMVTNHTTPDKGLTRKPADLLTGIILHYLIGVFFAIIYFYLWQAGVGHPTLFWSIVFGLLNGIFAMGFWFTFIRLHPRPPAIPVMSYVMAVGLSHVLFSIGVLIVYTL